MRAHVALLHVRAQRKLEQLDPATRALVDTMTADRGCSLMELSNVSEEGINTVKNHACDLLLQHRVERKTAKMAARAEDLLQRVHVARPTPRDARARPVHIPESVASARASGMEVERRRTERDIEAEQGGAGVYNCDFRKYYLLDHDEWKWDVIPEIMDGHNVADFVDPAIDERLAALDAEEAAREAAAEAEDAEDMVRARCVCTRLRCIVCACGWVVVCACGEHPLRVRLPPCLRRAKRAWTRRPWRQCGRSATCGRNARWRTSRSGRCRACTRGARRRRAAARWRTCRRT